MDRDVEIDGVAFMSLWHHDGRMVRGAGLFAFGRRDPDGGHTILHFELAQEISRAATVSHPRWDYAISQGMNEILVHLAGSQQKAGELAAEVACPPIRWALHPDEIEDTAEFDGHALTRVG
ncbi:MULTISPECIES: hypothetical protein [Caulobacter]|uniref:hypothetical protein n=1 Tax=Caulobacter TaxID=75 RepID=UPI000BB51488|nr:MULTISPECIES: hypothetical protein [Caulobacter]ATC24330.1 hypothetical protein CA608_07250 [Caulobacter vibrioides]MBQ1561970.1 hypothetical protein [Caulobacter sp.]